MKKYMTFLLSGVLMTSCLDTTVLPDNVIIGEDYWKNKDEVSAMVAGAYKAMVTEGVIERCIVWGDFRSDELDVTEQNISSAKKTALNEIKIGAITNTNTYADWTALYSVINKCNIVLERAPGVVNIDPSYTLGTLRTDESQMLALRALCYFYLVRAFRDVPVTPGAYMNSSQDFEIPQQAPLTVLDMCISDLERALQTPLSPQGYTDWRKVGLINRDAICALLADIHLWRGSMTHNADDYSKCVEYCDRVLASKKQMYPKDDISSMKDYANLLYSGEEVYRNIFVNGNSDESIFELQMNGQNDSNAGLAYMYWNYDNKGIRNTGILKAPTSLFKEITAGHIFLSAYDFRRYESCYAVASSDEINLPVFKMASTVSAGNSKGSDMKDVEATYGRGYSRINQNWIVYRMSDVMLMKAEALVQLGTDGSDELVRAFALVNEVNKRSIAKETFENSDTINMNSYITKESMEELVLEERQRELCFEGKRWFDLMRYNYRHVDGVQPDKILADIEGDMVANYKPMMDLMTRAMTNGQAVAAKIKNESYLYLPVLNSEMKVNFTLKQNPAWQQDDSYVKN